MEISLLCLLSRDIVPCGKDVNTILPRGDLFANGLVYLGLAPVIKLARGARAFAASEGAHGCIASFVMFSVMILKFIYFTVL